MKKLLTSLIVLLFASVASAQSNTGDMIGLGVPPEQAAQIDKQYSSAIRASEIPATGNTYDLGSGSKTWRNIYAGSQILTGDAVSVDLSAAGSGEFFARQDNDNAKFRAQAFGTSKTGFFACDRARGTAASPTALGADEPMCSFVAQGYDGTAWFHGAEILGNTTEAWTGSAHGSELEFLAILDGGTSQYAPLRLNTNGLGAVDIYGGALATGHIGLELGHASAETRFRNASSATMWSINNSGVLTSDATNGGGIALAGTGDTLAIDSSTAASACKGTGTFNGTTAVVINTTCATTSNMVMLTPTSDPTGSTAAYCWHSATSNGVSFSVDCDQANDGTFNWWILKEG